MSIVEKNDQPTSNTGNSTKPVLADSLPLGELRKLFHKCWTDNASGVYSKPNWRDLRDFLQTHLKCEV